MSGSQQDSLQRRQVAALEQIALELGGVQHALERLAAGAQQDAELEEEARRLRESLRESRVQLSAAIAAQSTPQGT